MLQRRYVALIVLGALAIAAPFILTDNFLRRLLVFFVIYSILALSLDIIMAYMGQFSFGHQAPFGLAAYTVGFLAARWRVVPYQWLSFGAGIGVAALFGLAVGSLTLRWTRGVYLAIITYGIGVILCQLFFKASHFTGGERGIAYIPFLTLPGVTFDTPFSFYYLALGFLVLTIYIIMRWLRSPSGRAVIAIRENEALANSTGVYSYRHYVMAFTLASALAGLAGSLFAYFITHITPALFTLDYVVMMIIMVVFGGTGTIGGPIIGSAIYTFLLRLLPVGMEMRLVIFGVIVLLTIIFLPRGIYPRLEAVLIRRGRALFK